MGLDNFWKDGEEDGIIEGSYRICGGMCSDHGNSSFRGKVYSAIVSSLTGTSLYQDKIENEEVVKMGKILAEAGYEKAASHSDYQLCPDEWEDFVKAWQEHAKEGHQLISWY